MYSADDVIQAAREIKGQLPLLLGEIKAQSVAFQLADLLAKADSGQAVDDQILELLTDESVTRRWLDARLNRPDDASVDVETEATRGFQSFPGMQPPPGQQTFLNSAYRYHCPVSGCKFFWDRIDSTEPMRPCPIHDCELVTSNNAT